jgi:beta-barrel assembly-enhancing protease
MNKPTLQILLIAALIAGCSGSGGGGGAAVGLGIGGGESDQNSSGSLLVDVGSNFMPNGTGGYLRAGVKLLSSFTITEADEDAMGRAVAVMITNTYPPVADRSLNDYVAKVGYTVTEVTPRADKNFVFAVLDTDEVGAYSGPNGYVMITRGAVARMRDEAELAGVLGHEIAHVCHEDALNAIRLARQSDAAAQAAETALNKNDNAGAFNGLIDLTNETVFKKGYDRRQELDADQAAVVYISDAGYDPSSYQRFVDRIAAEQGNGATRLFATHPGFDERKKAVADAIAKTGKAGVGATNADRFLAATAGIRPQ